MDTKWNWQLLEHVHEFFLNNIKDNNYRFFEEYREHSDL